MTDTTFSDVRISPQLQALLKRWLNFHRVLWALTLISFLIAWNRGLALLYGLFALLLALLCLSYLLPRWQLRRIVVHRGDIGELTAGEKGRITYRLDADRPRYHIELSESLAFAETEENRHFFEKLPSRSRYDLAFVCRRRGCFGLGGIQISSAYPFGIVKISRTVPAEPMEVLVLPKVVALSTIPRPLSADATTAGRVPIARKGGRDEFSGVREYRHGDELNRIHWPVSARHQNLVVKEYEKLDRPTLLVVIDCGHRFDVGHGERSTFEYAVTLAASMVRRASRQGIPSFVVTRQQRLQAQAVEAYRNDLTAFYESLALLSCEDPRPYPPLVEQACRRFPQASLVVTFRLDTDTRLPRLPRQSTNIVLEMVSQSFSLADVEPVDMVPRQEGNRLIYRIHADSELAGLFR